MSARRSAVCLLMALALAFSWTNALADCMSNGPRQLRCQRWRMEVSGPHGNDVLLDNTYAALIAERD
jgi:hypothetical protein